LDVASVAAGSPAAPSFDEVRQLYGASVHRFCLVVLGDAAAAEATARRALDAGDSAYLTDRPEPANVPLWLLGIACEVAGEARRRRRLARRPVTTPAPLDAALAAAARLPDREVAAAALRTAVGLGYAEIASLLGTSPEAARMSCGWALRRIRDEAGRT
jgi:DNA-directed RNA polymerase specialized sigma24 family protein